MSDSYANVIKIWGGATETAVDLAGRIESGMLAYCPYEKVAVWKKDATTYKRLTSEEKVAELVSSSANPSAGTRNLNMSDGNGFFEESNVTQGFHGSIEVLNGLDVKKEKIEHSSTVFPSTIENEVIFGVRDNAGGLQNFLRIRSGSKRPQINLNGTAHDLGYESDIPQWTEWTKGSITLPNETGTWEISGYMASEVSNFIGRPNAVTGRGGRVLQKSYTADSSDDSVREFLTSAESIVLGAGRAMVDLRITHKKDELFWLITGSLGGTRYPPKETISTVVNVQSSIQDTGNTCTLDRTNIYSYNGHVTELKWRKIS